MYLYPVLLPQVSNREDLLLTVSLFDDDTGQPMKLDGCTTATGQPFSGSAWTVTDGAVVTTSTTPFTIPVFPIVESLSAVFLTVGTNLAIVPGDPVTIVDTATGLNKMTGVVTSYTPSSGALLVQVGFTFLFEVRRHGPRFDGSGYIPSFDFGVPDEFGPLISASNGNGVIFVDIGIIQIISPASTFGKLRGGTYSVALVSSDGVNTRQIFVGQLPVIHGGVSRQGLSTVSSPAPLWD